VHAIRRVQAGQVKVKFSLYQFMKTQSWIRWYSSMLCFNSALEGGVWAAAHPDRFTSVQGSLLFLREAEWATGSVWKIWPPQWGLNPEPSTRSESLWRLPCRINRHTEELKLNGTHQLRIYADDVATYVCVLDESIHTRINKKQKL
jgi:hypothetical protein